MKSATSVGLLTALAFGLGILARADSKSPAPFFAHPSTRILASEDQQPSSERARIGRAQTAQNSDPGNQETAAGTAPQNTEVVRIGSGTNNDLEKEDADLHESAGVNPHRAIEVGSEKINVKQGGIDDVNAVGTRNIGGRGMGNWYSTESEIKMGKTYAMDIERSTRLITDTFVTEYVNRIGQNVVKNSDCKVPFTIKVIDSDEINAMSLPGGFFYVNSGLILNTDEEAEMAGVMAHEIAHVCAHHATRQMTRMNYTQLGMVPLIMMTGYGWTAFGIYEASQFAVPVAFLKFNRDFEAQADYLGIQYAYRAGYDPQAAITFFEKIQALEKRKPGMLAKAFSDHPQTPDRILHSQEEIARILPPRDQYTVTTSEFDDIKARLARIQNKRRLIDTRAKERPSLRRANAGSDSNAQETGDREDRPTLHRREDPDS